MKAQISTRSASAVTRKLVPQPDGSTLTQLQVDLGKLPTPDRNYLADSVGVEATEDGFRLLFAQEKASKEELRSLLIVRVSPECVRMLRETSEAFWPSLVDFLKKNGASPASMLVNPEEPEHVVAVRANMIAAGYAGREAELQFFHFAPFSAHRMRSVNDEPVIDPVVRVDLSTTKLHGMLKVLMESQLPEAWK